MAKQSLGYVELEWTCPFCQTRNPGRVKVCGNCGAAQPKDVSFEQAAEDKKVTDQAGLEMAKGGPDIHCPFCGTRNVSSATTCVRCGGDLTGAEQREAGQVLGGVQNKPAPDVICEYCGSPNPAANTKCANCGSPLGKAERPKPAPAAAPAGKMNPLLLIGGAVVLLVICGALAMFLIRGARTDTSTGTVRDVNWTRSIVVLGMAPVSRGAWADEVPAGAEVGSCSQRERDRSSSPVANAQEVCGTPYVVDQGTGFGEMVQDCEYIVYDDYCEYTVMELQPVGVLDESGRNLNPFWPESRLASGQELGERRESYEVTFTVDGDAYVYQPDDAGEFAQFAPGSEWQLEINGFGNIVSVEPAR